jgi:hypothetical protein
MAKTAEQLLRLQQWEQIAATIPENFERQCQAELMFGDDPSYIVWVGGIVTTAEVDGPTFGEVEGYENDPEYWAIQ